MARYAPHADGTASFVLALSHGEGPFVVDGAWAASTSEARGTATSCRV